MSQQSRRHDPYEWTWEIPLGIVLVILMVLVCGVHRCVALEAGSGPLGTGAAAWHGEAERLLGVTRLRRVRSVVRPDL
jgi:hypothetical protein